MKRGFRVLGIVFVFFGIVVVLNSALIFTGLSIAGSTVPKFEDVSRLGTLIGTGMLVFGAIFLKLSSERKTKE